MRLNSGGALLSLKCSRTYLEDAVLGLLPVEMGALAYTPEDKRGALGEEAINKSIINNSKHIFGGSFVSKH